MSLGSVVYELEKTGCNCDSTVNGLDCILLCRQSKDYDDDIKGADWLKIEYVLCGLGCSVGVNLT